MELLLFHGILLKLLQFPGQASELLVYPNGVVLGHVC